MQDSIAGKHAIVLALKVADWPRWSLVSRRCAVRFIAAKRQYGLSLGTRLNQQVLVGVA